MAKTQAQLLQEFNEQIKALESKKAEILNSAKIEAKASIEKILEETGFELSDLFELKTAKSTSFEVVVIDDVEYQISRRVTNEIKDALKKAGKDADSYDKKKLVEEFGKK